MPSAPLITGVSDTARWVAAYRARESLRPDALFVDPYAARLAGEHGEAIARALSGRAMGDGWPIVTRTRLIDDMIMAALGDGCDCVLNLAAGFDTRPYRLALPSQLPWFEADLPALVEDKQRLLAGDTPRCALQRVAVDLADPAARGALLDRVAGAGSRVLVLAEGLFVYLDEASVTAIGRDLHVRHACSQWVFDLCSPAMLRQLQRGARDQLQHAPLRFAPRSGLSFFGELGWHARDVRSLFHEGVRLRRVPWWLRPFALVPPPDAHAPGDGRWCGVVRLTREPPAPAHG